MPICRQLSLILTAGVLSSYTASRPFHLPVGEERRREVATGVSSQRVGQFRVYTLFTSAAAICGRPRRALIVGASTIG